MIAHGYGEHIGRYEHVAEDLAATRRRRLRPRPPRARRVRGRARPRRGLRRLLRRPRPGGAPRPRRASDVPLVAARPLARRPDRDPLRAGARRTRRARDLRAGDRRQPGDRGAARPGPDPRGADPARGAVTRPRGRRAYAEDPLVYHGPFKRATLESMFGAVRAVNEARPTGPADAVDPRRARRPAPLDATREAVGRIRGERLEEARLPGRHARGAQRDEQGRGPRRRGGVPGLTLSTV